LARNVKESLKQSIKEMQSMRRGDVPKKSYWEVRGRLVFGCWSFQLSDVTKMNIQKFDCSKLSCARFARQSWRLKIRNVKKDYSKLSKNLSGKTTE